ncbi:MAG: hypothetical protein HC849_07385 [Oscillatoriales cyanobacterium RU_3_3]|nr:hypothetical protein [Microcoleus sp. SU_5_6]NJM60037.1 hypothetical protein [Oscillatoriales cyanobacterium RU_3_3]
MFPLSVMLQVDRGNCSSTYLRSIVAKERYRRQAILSQQQTNPGVALRIENHHAEKVVNLLQLVDFGKQSVKLVSQES